MSTSHPCVGCVFRERLAIVDILGLGLPIETDDRGAQGEKTRLERPRPRYGTWKSPGTMSARPVDVGPLPDHQYSVAKASERARLVSLDLLRVLAIFAVVILHSAAPLLVRYNDQGAARWWIGNLYDSSVRWCVPVFVMLSGALLLGQPDSLPDFWAKRARKVLVPFVFWSFVYTGWSALRGRKSGDDWFGFVSGPVYYHLWFFYTLLGLYLVSPLLNAFLRAADKRLIAYFLVVWFVWGSVLPALETAFGVDFAFTNARSNSPLHYVGYYLLGFVLRDRPLATPRQRAVGVSAFSLGLGATALGTYYLTVVIGAGRFDGSYYEYFSINVLLMSLAVFGLVQGISAPFSKVGGRERDVCSRPGPKPRSASTWCMRSCWRSSPRARPGSRSSPRLFTRRSRYRRWPSWSSGSHSAIVLLLRAVPGAPEDRAMTRRANVARIVLALGLLARIVWACDKATPVPEFTSWLSLAKSPIMQLSKAEAWHRHAPSVKKISIASTLDGSQQRALYYDSGSLASQAAPARAAQLERGFSSSSTGFRTPVGRPERLGVHASRLPGRVQQSQGHLFRARGEGRPRCTRLRSVARERRPQAHLSGRLFRRRDDDLGPRRAKSRLVDGRGGLGSGIRSRGVVRGGPHSLSPLRRRDSRLLRR